MCNICKAWSILQGLITLQCYNIFSCHLNFFKFPVEITAFLSFPFNEVQLYKETHYITSEALFYFKLNYNCIISFKHKVTIPRKKRMKTEKLNFLCHNLCTANTLYNYFLVIITVKEIRYFRQKCLSCKGRLFIRFFWFVI